MGRRTTLTMDINCDPRRSKLKNIYPQIRKMEHDNKRKIDWLLVSVGINPKDEKERERIRIISKEHGFLESSDDFRIEFDDKHLTISGLEQYINAMIDAIHEFENQRFLERRSEMITIRISSNLLRDVKEALTIENEELSSVVREALQEIVKKKQEGYKNVKANHE